MTKPYPPPDSGVPGPENRPRRPQPPGGRGRTRSAGKGVDQETGSYSQRTRDGGGDRANASSQPVSNPAGRGARFFALGGEGPERPRRPCSLPRARRAGGDPETSPAPRAPSPARGRTRERSAAGRGGAPSGEGGAQGRAGGGWGRTHWGEQPAAAGQQRGRQQRGRPHPGSAARTWAGQPVRSDAVPASRGACAAPGGCRQVPCPGCAPRLPLRPRGTPSPPRAPRAPRPRAPFRPGAGYPPHVPPRSLTAPPRRYPLPAPLAPPS